MPVRIRITLLFASIVVILLVLMSGTIYYFTYSNRIAAVKTRLSNRAITTARLLSQSETFNRQLIEKIDALTAMALKNKTVQAYDSTGQRIYAFSDHSTDLLNVDQEMILRARESGSFHFSHGEKDAIAYNFGGKDGLVMIAAAYDEFGKRNLRQLSFILVLSTLGGVVISLLSGYFFSKKLLSPIKNIADELNEISAQDLNRRIETRKINDEWNYLSGTLNQLLDRLQDSFETQRRFISNASHELSTPLTSMSSQLQVYLQKDRNLEEYKKVMHSVYQDVQHMSSLTKTLLEFAKTSGNAGGLELNLVRIDEIILRLPSEIQKINSDYSVTLSFNDLPEEENKLLVFGNEDLLFTAVKNIVLNGCKYSPDHQSFVTLKIDESGIQIIIEDNGMGIPEKSLSKVFEPFYRLEETRDQEGFGLGLSLAKRILRLHKGDITVSSSIGEGSCFTILLPHATGLMIF
jgi:signal transduction histidine kinase